MTTTLARTNRYAARCVRCGANVPAEQGLLARTDDGKWAADHPADCPTKPVTVAVPVARVTSDGIYRTPDGTVYKVQEARQGNGRLYAKRLELSTCGGGCGHPTTVQPDGTHAHGHFEYAAGAIHQLTAAMKLDKDAAAAFGRLYGVCVRCGADLTDETSIAAGLGPVCAGRF